MCVYVFGCDLEHKWLVLGIRCFLRLIGHRQVFFVRRSRKKGTKNTHIIARRASVRCEGFCAMEVAAVGHEETTYIGGFTYNRFINTFGKWTKLANQLKIQLKYIECFRHVSWSYYPIADSTRGAILGIRAQCPTDCRNVCELISPVAG